MSALERVAPVWVVECDNTKCFRVHVPEGYWERRSDRHARRDAEAHGWQVRHFKGRGSRSLPDLCPEHREATP